jgi:hypothetical protein
MKTNLILNHYRDFKKYILHELEYGHLIQEEYTQLLGRAIQLERTNCHPNDESFKQLEAAAISMCIKSPDIFHYDFDEKGNIIILKTNPLKADSRNSCYKASSK